MCFRGESCSERCCEEFKKHVLFAERNLLKKRLANVLHLVMKVLPRENLVEFSRSILIG